VSVKLLHHVLGLDCPRSPTARRCLRLARARSCRWLRDDAPGLGYIQSSARRADSFSLAPNPALLRTIAFAIPPPRPLRPLWRRSGHPDRVRSALRRTIGFAQDQPSLAPLAGARNPAKGVALTMPWRAIAPAQKEPSSWVSSHAAQPEIHTDSLIYSRSSRSLAPRPPTARAREPSRAPAEVRAPDPIQVPRIQGA
jgi:hypothetical protein